MLQSNESRFNRLVLKTKQQKAIQSQSINQSVTRGVCFHAIPY